MSAGVDLVRWIIDGHRADGPSSRAAAILLRHHLEAAVAMRSSGLRTAPPETDLDDALAAEIRLVRLQLARACCRCPRTPPPSREELKAWADLIARLDADTDAEAIRCQEA
jgi:hypothetical protein